MIRNAEIMRSLGLEIAAEAVRETPQKKQTAKVPKAAEEETSWNGSNVGSSDEESPKKRKPAPPRTEANRPGRSCKKARASTAPPQPLTFGSELEGRRLRVHFHTEDVGGMACHHGSDILRHRRRRGKDEHLVRWDTEGAEDEWLCLAEEEHYVLAPGEEENAADDDAEAAYRPGGCVAVFAGGSGGGRRGGGAGGRCSSLSPSAADRISVRHGWPSAPLRRKK
jgi:hypothetical protein